MFFIDRILLYKLLFKSYYRCVIRVMKTYFENSRLPRIIQRFPYKQVNGFDDFKYQVKIGFLKIPGEQFVYELFKIHVVRVGMNFQYKKTT